MSLKLGELLISEGIITQEQLDEALKCHVIFGVKLGSSLIELGYVKQDVLLNLLSRKLGVPPVSYEELYQVPPDIIAKISPAMAEKFRVVPIKLENKRLHVAMSDPTDFKAQEELAFITGNIIVPAIAADVQIFYALEKHYNVKLDHRYVSANFELQKSRFQDRTEETSPFITDDSKYTISADYTAPVADPSVGLINVPIPRDIEKSAPQQPAAVQRAPDSSQLEHYSIDRLSLELSKTTNRDEVADVFIRYLGQEFARCALMTIRGSVAFGWRAVTDGNPVENFGEVDVDLAKSRQLNPVYTEKRYFLGPLTESAENASLIKALKLVSGNPVLSLPVIMNDRVVALIVVSAEPSSLLRKLDELQKLVFKASLAFQILVLRNKLLQT